MKEQNKTPEKELNKVEISNLSDTEFKTLVIRMLKELSEDLNSIKMIQSEMTDTLIEIKNNRQGINSTVDEAKNQINDLEHKEAKQNKTKNKKQTQPIRIKTRKKNPKNEASLSSTWDNFKHSNISIVGVKKKKRKSKKLEIYLKK